MQATQATLFYKSVDLHETKTYRYNNKAKSNLFKYNAWNLLKYTFTPNWESLEKIPSGGFGFSIPAQTDFYMLN